MNSFAKSYLAAALLVLPFFTVAQKADQTITFSALASKTYGDPNFDLTATASSGLAVSYSSSNLAVATISGSTVTIVGAGQTTIKASQAGDNSFNAAADITQVLVVAKANQVITFPEISDHAYGDSPFTLNVSSSSGLILSFVVNNPSVGSAFANMFSISGAGQSSITASQPGNNNYNAATPVTRNIFVTKSNQTINFQVLATKKFGNSPFIPNANASSTLPVTFESSDPSIATVNGNQIVIKGAGIVDIIANQIGNSNFFPAVSVLRTLTIDKAPQTLTFLSQSTATYGGPSFPVAVTSNSGLAVTPIVSQYDSVARISSGTVNIIGAGTTTITVYQSGDQNYLPGIKTQTLVVNKASQTITFDAIPSQPFGNPPVLLSATASSGLPVTFNSRRKAVATISGNVLILQSIGTSTITASQVGNTNYLPASTVNQIVTVTGSTQTYPMIGITRRGGNGRGEIFKMNSDGSAMMPTHLFEYSSNNLPNGGLIRGSDNKLYGVLQAGGVPANGVVFSMNSDGSVYTVLHNFSNSDGSFPTGSLIEASNGFLYGTTTYGGLNAGVIYRIQKNGTSFSVLHQFNSGYNPGAGLVQATDGKLYGTTLQGGSIGYGTMYTIGLDGTGYSEIIAFDGVAKGSTPRGAPVQGADQFLYGMTANGGSQNQGVLFKVKTDGTSYTKLVEFNGTAGGHGGSSVIFGSDGKIYGMTQLGGANNDGTIFSVASDGSGFSSLYSFNSSVSGRLPLGSLVEGSDGYLYGMTNEGGTLNLGVVFKIKKDGTNFIRLVDFNGTNGSNPMLGPLFEVQNDLFLGITYRGGTSDAGIIFSISSAGTYALVKDFPQPESTPESLVFNENATKVFGVATAGGPSGGGTIFSANADGSNYSNVVNMSGNYLFVDKLTHVSDNTVWGIAREGVVAFTYFLFKANDDGTGFQRVVNLDDPSIAFGARQLIEFSTDYLYGSTDGTSSNGGAIFKIKKDGTGLARVAGLPAGTSGGSGRIESILKHRSGALYGLAYEGGTSNDGVLFKVDPNNIYTKLFDLKSSTSGGGAKKIIELNDGSLCVVTSYGASNGLGGLFTIDENGQGMEKIFDFSTQTGTSPTDLIQIGEGDLFVSLANNGALGNGSIVKVRTDGSGFAKVFDFNGTNGSEPNGILFKKEAQTITSFTQIPDKEYLDKPFTLSATSSSGTSIIFASSDNSIATVNGYLVTIRGVGTVTISAQIPANGNHLASPIVQRAFNVSKSSQQLILSAIPQKRYGDQPFKLTATTSSGLPVSLSIDNVGVAILSHGVVTIVAPGTAVITASVASNSNFNNVAQVQASLSVVKGIESIQFDPISTKYVNSPPFIIPATSLSGRSVTFSSSAQSIATILNNLAILTGSVGPISITASIPGDIYYQSVADVSRSFTVSKLGQLIIFDAIPDKAVTADAFKFQNPQSTAGLPVALTCTSPHVSISGNALTILSAGRVTIDTDQPGNAAYLAAQQLSRTFCIIPSKPTIRSNATNPSQIVLTSSASSGNEWFRNGTLLAGKNEQTFTATENGAYTVRTNIEGCLGAQSDAQTLVVLGLNEEVASAVKVYPNPASHTLFITLPETTVEPISKLTIMDMLGREYMHLESGNPQVDVDVRALPDGLYILKLIVAGQTVKRRFVKI